MRRSSRDGQRALVGLHELDDDFFLHLGWHADIALHHGVDWKRAIPIQDRSSLGSLLQDLDHQRRTDFGVALAGDQLMQNRSNDTVAHYHGLQGERGIATNKRRDFFPLVLATELQDNLGMA